MVGSLRCTSGCGKTFSASRHGGDYRDMPQIPRDSMVDGLTRERHRNDQLLRFAILLLGSPDFVQVEHEVPEVVQEPTWHAGSHFLRTIRGTCRQGSSRRVFRFSMTSDNWRP